MKICHRLWHPFNSLFGNGPTRQNFAPQQRHSNRRPLFRSPEGSRLFCLDQSQDTTPYGTDQPLVGIILNVSCPGKSRGELVESPTRWHPPAFRRGESRHFGLIILGQCRNVKLTEDPSEYQIYLNPSLSWRGKNGLYDIGIEKRKRGVQSRVQSLKRKGIKNFLSDLSEIILSATIDGIVDPSSPIGAGRW